MLNYKRRRVVDSFWDNYGCAGFNREDWRETSKDQYRYTNIEQDNGELIVDELRQTSSARIPCAISDISLFVWTRPDKKYMCLMFHEIGQNELCVHRYYARNCRND